MSVTLLPRVRVALAATLSAAVLSACSYEFSARSLGVPVTMAEALAQPVPGDTFRVTTRALHMFWGLVPARQPNLQAVLANQLGDGASVHSLTIRGRKELPDLFITVLTLGVFSTTSVTFEGVVARPGR